MKTIFISAYRNVSIRYVLNSDIFKKLRRNKNIRFIIFIKKEQIEYCKNLYPDNNIKFVNIYFETLFKQLRSRLGSFFNLYRMLTCPQNNLPRNETVDIFFTTYQDEWSTSKKRKVIFFLIKLFAYAGSNHKLFRSFMIYLESLFSTGNVYGDLFKKYDPSLLIVSSVGHMIDVYIMNAAKNNKVPILVIFHNWDGPTTKGYKASKIDYAVSWNRIMSEEIINYQEVSPENIFLGGSVNHELYYKIKKKSEDHTNKSILIEKNKKIIYAPGGISLWPNNFEPLYQILQKNNDNTYPNKLDIILRVHPNFISHESKGEKIKLKDNINTIIEDIKLSFPNNFSLSIPKVKYFISDYQLLNDDLFELGELLNSADIIITQYSTLLLEAAIFDLPAICIGYGTYRDSLKPANYYEKSTHIKTIMKFQSYYTAYNPLELDKYIVSFLCDPNIKSQERLELFNDMFPIRKDVGNNIAHYIEKLVIKESYKRKGNKLIHHN